MEAQEGYSIARSLFFNNFNFTYRKGKDGKLINDNIHAQFTMKEGFKMMVEEFEGFLKSSGPQK